MRHRKGRHRKGRGSKRKGKRRDGYVVEPPMALVMGAMAIGMFVGALLAPQGEEPGGVLTALLEAVSVIVR